MTDDGGSGQASDAVAGPAERRGRPTALGRGAVVAIVTAVAALAVVVAVVVQRPWADDVRSNDPVGLVGLWHVSVVGDESERVWLMLGGDGGQSLELWRACGWSPGAWDGGRTVFIASVEGASGVCPHDERSGAGFAPGWLWEATGYAATDGGWELLDHAGTVLARLGADEPPAYVTADLAMVGLPDGPVVTDDLRTALAEPAPLPAGLTAPAADDLLGRWVPPGTFPTEPSITFGRDGWEATDGCNGTVGRWAIEDEGRLFSASTMLSTAEACDGSEVAGLMSRAERVGLDGDELVLLGAAGDEIGRLLRG